MTAPVTLIAGFIANPASAFSDLWPSLPWERREMTPRRECWMNDFGMPYTYGRAAGARTYDPQPWNHLIQAIQQRLLVEWHGQFDCCFTNGYEDGSDALGWHSDDSPEIDPGRPIAVVSLGAEREIWFRPIGTKGDGETQKLLLPNGSLLLMHAGMQQTHQHRIPKASFSPCPPRISLTYRGLVRKRSLQDVDAA